MAPCGASGPGGLRGRHEGLGLQPRGGGQGRVEGGRCVRDEPRPVVDIGGRGACRGGACVRHERGVGVGRGRGGRAGLRDQRPVDGRRGRGGGARLLDQLPVGRGRGAPRGDRGPRLVREDERHPREDLPARQRLRLHHEHRRRVGPREGVRPVPRLGVQGRMEGRGVLHVEGAGVQVHGGGRPVRAA